MVWKAVRVSEWKKKVWMVKRCKWSVNASLSYQSQIEHCHAGELRLSDSEKKSSSLASKVNSLKEEGTNAISINTKENNIIEVIPESEELGFVGIPNEINIDILKDNLEKIYRSNSHSNED